MKEINYEEIITPQLISGAILHTHEPFTRDYLVLHCLLKKYNPASVLEIGTHIGEGTQIICNAVPEAKVYSLDLPDYLSEFTLQHPILKDMRVGQLCTLKYKQILADSMSYQYLETPCEAYFVDGEHTEKNVFHETTEILKLKPKLIVYHDSDISEVWNAITNCFEWNKDYDLYRVTGTRIAYAIRL